MLKLKYLEENFDLARHALAIWRHDEDTLVERMKWFRISSNAVYPFDRDGRLCFLRMAPAEEKESLELLGEIDFLEYLNRCGYPAMRPIPAENGERLLLLDTPWGVWYASVFEGVPGCPLEDLPMTAQLAEAYGGALGRLHELSMRYHSPVKRRSEREVLSWTRQTLGRYAAPAQLLERADEVAQQLAALPRMRTQYGLIHYDFEPDNVFWDGERFSVIDFEDGMLHFYAADVAQALDELPEAYHKAFLQGYRAVCPDVYTAVGDLQLMRHFRDLYSCARLLHCLSEKPVPEPNWMPQLTSRLEQRLHELVDGLS